MPGADIDPAVSEREEFGLDCGECGTQAAECSGSHILGEGYFVSTVGRNEEMIRAYIRNQEIAGIGSAAIEARVLMKSHLVPESFITASGGSPSNPQLCWGLLAHHRR